MHRLLLMWGILILLCSIVACTMPLLETLGYEFSLFSSLLVSLAGGQLAARYPHLVRHQQAPYPGARFPTLMMYSRVLFSSLILGAIPLAVALINRSITPPCNEMQGLAFYGLMPMCSLVLATAVGLLLGVVFSGLRLASFIWFVVFFLSLGWAFYTFYSGPAVYLYGPFFGYFPGVLYDELVEVDYPLVTYRIGTLFQTGLVLAFISAILDISTLRPASPKALRKKKMSRFVIVLLLGAIVAGFYLAGPTLRHRTEREHVEKVLSRVIKKDRLDIYLCPSIDEKSAMKLADDAEFSLHQVESFLGLRAEKRITVFVFSSVGQKGELMGASGTNVAKPWRSEVYVTAGRPPHMVLRHELAHAVSASIGSGPFAISARFLGLWPNPGLIEGLAVAAGGQRGELSIHSWAAAMKKLGLLPPLKSIFGFGFFNLSASSAYTAAGSFCDFTREKYGEDTLKKAYKKGGWSGITGRKVEDLEKEWLGYLDTVTLRPKDLAAARQRFDRPAVVHSVCVHEVARLRAQAQQLAGKGMWKEAIALFDQAVEVSGKATSERLQLFFALADAGRKNAVRGMGEKLLVDEEISRATRMSIEEILADMDVEEGKLESGGAVYAKLAQEVAGESEIRRLQAKAHFVNLRKETIKYLLKILYLEPGPEQVSEPLSALLIADAYADSKEDPVVTYILARQHFRYENYPRTIELFKRAERLGLAGISVEMLYSARMAIAESLFELQRYGEAKTAFESIQLDTSFGDGLRKIAEDWAKRSEYYQKKDPLPW